MEKENILNYLSEHKDELFRDFSLTKIGLFGSYVTGEADEESDIDILIESSKKDFFLRDDLREYLQNIFGKSVDIGYIDSVRTFYKDRIEKEIIYV